MQQELDLARQAVRAASHACRAVQERLVRPETIEKRDRSPVTVADFASQAIVCALLERHGLGDPVVGEEDSHELRAENQTAVREVVVEQVRVGLDSPDSVEQVLAWIDLGGAEASGHRYWTLDPIDGTKGFLRGDQYAVALGLIEEGQVVLGVLGCPNLALDGGRGAMFSAVRGGVAEVEPLWGSDAPAREIAVGSLQGAADARFCESVESGHSNQQQSAKIAALLGITGEPFRIDSQCKYAAVARNDASIYLRMPTRKSYREKIWDHAAGSVIVEAAGGRVTDVEGRPLDFTCGRTLERNSGVVATSGAIHDEVIDAVRRARA